MCSENFIAFKCTYMVAFCIFLVFSFHCICILKSLTLTSQRHGQQQRVSYLSAPKVGFPVKDVISNARTFTFTYLQTTLCSSPCWCNHTSFCDATCQYSAARLIPVTLSNSLSLLERKEVPSFRKHRAIFISQRHVRTASGQCPLQSKHVGPTAFLLD